MNEETKKCPKCKEEVLKGAKKCKHCGSNLEGWFDRHKLLTIFLLLLLISSVDLGSDTNNTSNQVQPVTKTAVSTVPPTTYEIVKQEDLSRKAMGNKSLSDFTSQELAALPTNKKIKYHIVVPSTIKANQVNSTVNKIVSDITLKDNDIDEIVMFLYSDKELAINSGAYDVATAVWAPLGDLGNVTPEIAKNNDRSGYSTKVDVKPNLDSYLSQRAKNETLFGLTEEQRRQFFKELVSADDRAREEADKLFSIDTDYENNKIKFDELSEKYASVIRTKYKISKDQEMEITNEAFKEGWSLD